MGGLMRPEFLLLLVAGMLLFGAKRLPEMGSAIGKTIKEFQRSMREVTEPEKPATPTPAALPQAQADAQVTPKAITPAENTTVPATHAESAAE